MQFLHCLVRFSTPLDLKSVAAVISEHLLAGTPFVDTDEFDESPGVRLETNILMLAVRICGKTPEFGLHIDTQLPEYTAGDFPKLEIVNIAAYVENILRGIDQIKIIST